MMNFDYEKNDITEINMQDFSLQQHCEDTEKLARMKQTTPARLAAGHTGARYLTPSYLRFRADQAAAADAVFSQVDAQTVKDLGIFEVQTKCTDKNSMITRPDLGRLFDESTIEEIKSKCKANPDVQIYVGDGLSAPSVGANTPTLLPNLISRLENQGLSVGTPFFVRYCRVNTARVIGPALGAKITCVLLGERPGLLTSESMSAYMAINARADMQESEYTVVSNISRHGIKPEQAAEQICEMMVEILKCGKSGVEYTEYKNVEEKIVAVKSSDSTNIA